VQHPLAVEAERGDAGSGRAQPVGVGDPGVRAVDRLQAVGLGRDQDAHQRVVVRVELVPCGAAAHGERAHPDRRHEVGRAEDQRDQPGRGGRDRLHRGQPGRVLDLRLDPGTSRRKPRRLLDLAEQHVQPDHGGRRADLGQHQRVNRAGSALDHRDHVLVGPRGGRPVDPDRDQRAAEAAFLQRRYREAARGRLGGRGDRVLQVEHDLVGRHAARLGQEPLAAGRHRQAGPARPVRALWVHLRTISRGRAALSEAHGQPP
jgi:hypothetical protein